MNKWNLSSLPEKEKKPGYIGFCEHDNHFELYFNYNAKQVGLSWELI